MRHLPKLTIILVLMIYSGRLQAQASQVYFTLESTNVSFSGQSLNIASAIVLQGSGLRWTQENDGTVNITDFQVTGTSGEWDQASFMGALTHTIAMDGDHLGTFVLEGTTNGVTAILSVDVDGAVAHYTFSINSINFQQ
ncbi:hypothetical protein ESY86_09605 [Subsaximicrobium wynnwilliamsii]|uniref:DUF4402 domain-containing protein n=1 Tax=Subsaximicrobium wynnwilliamsii TaxID=291179 RepID=A0A5C6ZJ11_9FLAO|nr:hypothetical protein [Subsaximicrobium wynnwilliamsii]TXD83439.1 hypothetical protein ESY87_09205 [Subsaximicrobium wynnwilliamsii]TXD89286.1 hypothetical protein ESY86_09605 [Subsaximicrobium wynnwilliamsii]TXE03119.1 hypothetical protein ESY88_08915 [Subsaximicrobium wynnwilliamsii]